MQTTFALLALAAAATVYAQSSAYVETLTPTASAPSGCATSYSGSFEITVVKPSSSKRDVVEKRAECASSGTLVATLDDGVLTDSLGRIGGIVANYQFQFDGPPSQAGTIYNKGWSVCSNGSLAIGGSALFYQCLSGDFYNLYSQSTGDQCSEVLIDVLPCSSSSGASSAADGQVTAASAVSTATDGQVTAASAATAASQYSDGQIQASSAGVAVSQYTDGQVQASSATPIAQITDGQIQASSAGALPVAQYTDGQLQVTSNPPTVTAVAQITDGQIQASSATPVAQITDGQVQASSAVTPVAQISDGQIQATTLASTGLTSNKTASATQAQYTGAANSVILGSELLAAAVGVVAVALL